MIQKSDTHVDKDNEMVEGDRGAPSTVVIKTKGSGFVNLGRFGAWLPASVVGVLIIGGIGSYMYYANPWRSKAPEQLGQVSATGSVGGAGRSLGAAGDGGISPVPTVKTDLVSAEPISPVGAPLSNPGALPNPPERVTATPIAGQSNVQPQRNSLDAPIFGGSKGGFGSSGGATDIQSGQGLAKNATPQNDAAKTGMFDGNLTAAATPRAVASLLANRSLLLAKGATILCSLNTALISGLPGMTSCTVPKAIYSDDGRTVLIDPGTTVTGEFNGQVKTGQSRFPVLWTRIKTPKGVVVNLDSPGADSLGRTGVTGDVNNHWWERIGSAFMLSMVQDGIGYAATRGAGNNNGATQMYFQNTQQAGTSMANTILKETINIPPTISTNQGDLITIFVARDIDFSSVYAVKGQ